VTSLVRIHMRLARFVIGADSEPSVTMHKRSCTQHSLKLDEKSLLFAVRGNFGAQWSPVVTCRSYLIATGYVYEGARAHT
jgi:hypothetical protein